ncbi:LOW QUALITY PROTEIN: cytochrome P450 71B34-like [Rutidosis leptorrhynchoides]|uniref:LOW QUALITY PROTEIN: cytochrome P450 71B34-like n=1 Tax=Rutidosis leptorrhynchoides TaxID=125765 RepID=UPI003A9A3CF8
MELSSSPLLLLFLPILVLLVLVKWKRHQMIRKLNLPPGPPGLPIIGNLHQLGPLAHQSLYHISKKYGPVIFLKLGRVPTVVVSSADSAKQVLKTHDLECCSRPPLAGTGRLSYEYLDVAFTPYGDYWREMRKFCVLELLSLKRVQSFRFIREEEVEFMINSISEYSATGQQVDLSEKILSLTADVTCRAAFGKSFRGGGLDNDRFQNIVHEAVEMLGSFSAADFFPYFGWIVDRISGLYKRRERCFRDLDAFYHKLIHDHLNSTSNTKKLKDYDILDIMLEFHKNPNDSNSIQLTENHIKAMLMDIFLAGVDTGEITMVFAMAELAKNPRIMKKAQEEVRNLVGNKGKVSEADIEKLSYLKLIVKETFRLHPPSVLLLPREAMSKFQINGYDVYPGTRIQVNVWGIGRDPTIWQNPEEFIPERFEESPIDYKGQHFELLPFGGGRRGCPAIMMGVSVVELALANLLYCFDWKVPDGMKEEDISMEEGPGLSVYKKEPLKLVPIRYNMSS